MRLWLPRLARLAYWLACCSCLCLLWMVIAYPIARHSPPPLKGQIVWWTFALYAPLSAFLGGVAWLGIQSRVPKRQGLAFAEAAIVVGLGACAVIDVGGPILWGIIDGFRNGHGAHRTSCLSNAKQSALAMLMYAQDYDEQFPRASNWNTLLMPYTKNDHVFRCPVEDDDTTASYGMNRWLTRAHQSQIEAPADTVLLLDAQPGANRTVGIVDYPFTDRHDFHVNVAFVDGHAKWVQTDKTLGLIWNIAKLKPVPAPVKPAKKKR